MSTAEIIARLTAATQKLDQAKAKAAAAANDAAEAKTLVAGALQGSSAGALLSHIDKVIQLLHESASAAGPARQRMEETISKAQALGA
jgi:hypothetical protein